MARTIVDIPDALLAEVDALCKLLGISRAEAARQALESFALTRACARVNQLVLVMPENQHVHRKDAGVLLPY